MTETTEAGTGVTSVDFGQSLASLLRRYLDSAGAAVSDLPGGPRGYQVMWISSTAVCSNQAAIAESLGLDRTVMTYLVDDLEKVGLVERRPDPGDRRARQVLLTEKGCKAFAAAAERVSAVEREVLGALSDTDAELFRELLHRITVSGPVVHTIDSCSVPQPES